MNTGEVGILNIGAGDIKLSFDKNNPAERIRAARIVKDMLRRGYALLVEVEDGKGGKTTQRATDFDENTCEYIVADFDPVAAGVADLQEAEDAADAARAQQATANRRGPRIHQKRVAADKSKATAVARTAGG